MFYNDAKKEALKNLKATEDQYKHLVIRANDITLSLYEKRKSAALAIQRGANCINTLANSPKEFQKTVHEVSLSIQEFNEAVKIEEENSRNNIKGFGTAAGGTVIGGTIAAIGPTAAMAIATTFGTASTGTAIASLSGAAATNAALAWLGGGALAAGGGGMAAGNALLALAGPIGWGIAATLATAGGIFASYKNKAAAEEAQKVSLAIESKIRQVDGMIQQMNNILASTDTLKRAISVTPFNLAPSDYRKFSEEWKKRLAILINNTKSLGVLINERIN